jgi:hypothetical protein
MPSLDHNGKKPSTDTRRRSLCVETRLPPKRDWNACGIGPSDDEKHSKQAAKSSSLHGKHAQYL